MKISDRQTEYEPRIATGEVAEGCVRVKVKKSFWTTTNRVYPSEIVDIPEHEYDAVKDWCEPVEAEAVEPSNSEEVA